MYLEINSCTFENNRGEGYGGSIYIDKYNTLITGSTFTGNIADQGGAIYSNTDADSLSEIVIKDSSFERNIALEFGAAIAWREKPIIDHNIKFTENLSKGRLNELNFLPNQLVMVLEANNTEYMKIS